jgi:hypothetical protein
MYKYLPLLELESHVMITHVYERLLGVKGCAGTAMGILMRNNISLGSNRISPGKSPVPYLLAGVGAMLLLIAFALIILGWSYFRERTTEGQEVEVGGGRKNEMTEGTSSASDDKDDMRVIVIMAGDEKPTFIAKPMSVAVADN